MTESTEPMNAESLVDFNTSTMQLASQIEKSDILGLDKEVFRLATLAYNSAQKYNYVNNHKLVIIDYSKPSTDKRLWVFDMDDQKLLMNLRVSHGKNSGDLYASNFSNIPHSYQTSIGVMRTGSTYIGKNGLSLNLYGLESINDNVFKRRVVIHGANYVNENMVSETTTIGRSFGCPAVASKYSEELINLISKGSIIFSYYPKQDWLKNSKFLASI